MSATFLILLTAGSIALLLILIMVVRVQAFLALLLVSIIVAIVGGIPITEITQAIQDGMGGTLGYIAIVVGIGTMLGEIVQVSGGAQRIADTIIRSFGENKSQWALAAVGLIVAIPVFFEVALILFIPLIYDMTRKTGRSILYYGIPLVGGIAVAHAFIPPTPGPVAVASLIGADLGWVILMGIIAGVPSAAVGGVFFGKFIAKKIHRDVPDYMEVEVPESAADRERKLPSFGMVISIIALPLVLILLNTGSDILLAEGDPVRRWLSLIGHPFTALLLATLLSFYLLGTRLGFTAAEIQKIASRSMEPVGMIILVTGAGGAFGQILIATGVGEALVGLMEDTNMPVILFAFLVATVVRVSQGSATVAMVTAAGLIAPIVSMGDYSAPLLACITIAIACGGTVLSHVNDSGFWLVNQYMGLTEKETLQSWTVMETIIGLTGLAVVMTIGAFL
ncbi:gluconate transporter [Rhodohalobacter sp. SW132]|uniref:GntP family permease n=1 Tax=Rhodohalobacter sp. SW132 TaxID=2293433 RepID=UPI000E2213CE|nr:gluconate:H+ symporter [Rhodohalobacter sp. SW132]REL24531.1 gluconate transporter [Rhodohalobacter sp. SW132]